MTDKAKGGLAVVALVAVCAAGGMAVAILQDPNPTYLKDINFWLVMLGIFSVIGLIFVVMYYLSRSLRWLGSKIATQAETSLPPPIFNACRWLVRLIAATWHVLILLFFALSLGRRFLG